MWLYRDVDRERPKSTAASVAGVQSERHRTRRSDGIVDAEADASHRSRGKPREPAKANRRPAREQLPCAAVRPADGVPRYRLAAGDILAKVGDGDRPRPAELDLQNRRSVTGASPTRYARGGNVIGKEIR